MILKPGGVELGLFHCILKFVLNCILLSLCSKSILYSEDKYKSKLGYVDFNFYPYTEVSNDNSFTINIFSKLPKRLHYFSLTNFSNQSDRDELSELNGFYTEQNLRWAFSGKVPFDLTVQWNALSGKDNDKLRLGARWRIHQSPYLKNFFNKIKTKYSINFHFLQIDHFEESRWQIEHVYRVDFNDRLYIGAFGDQNFGGNGDPTWVTEHQIGFRLYDWWYAIAEYRRNEYRVGDENSIGIGLEYVIKF